MSFFIPLCRALIPSPAARRPRRPILPLSFFIFLPLLLGAAGARSEDRLQGDRGLESLWAAGRAMEPIKSVSGFFTQEKFFDHLREPVKARGRFFFARPDFLRWEYLEPAWSRLEADGEKLAGWSGSPEAPVLQPEARTEAARPALREALGWLNFDPQALAAAYETRLEREEPLTLSLRPRRAQARRFLKSLELEFSPDRRSVRRLVLHEAESRTVLFFERVRLNQPRP